MELNKSYIKNLELIGSGCFGKVYKDRNVVYKLYRESFDNYEGEYKKNPALSQSILNKYKLNKLIKLNSEIKGSNLITDLIYINGNFVGVKSKFIDGDALSNIKDNLSFCSKIKISKDIIKNIQELYYYNIFPIDIHLSNIILDKGENIKLIDLDDPLTKVRIIKNLIITKSCLLHVKQSLYELFGYYDFYGASFFDKYITKTRIPNFSSSFSGLKKFLEYKSIPINISFTGINNNYNDIERLFNSNIKNVFVYNEEEFSLAKIFIKNYYDKGIAFDNIINYSNKEMFLNNYNVSDCYDFTRHVLRK